MPTEILGLDVLVAGQPQKEVTVNTALRQIEGRLVRALSRATTTPPTSPAEGASYIVAASSTGAWAGQDNKIAHFFGGGWKFWQPIEGIRLWVNDEDKVYAWDGSAWAVTGGDPTAAIAAHVAASDPHPGYLTPAEGNAAYDALGAAAAAVAAHAAAGDPHPAYLTQTEGDARYLQTVPAQPFDLTAFYPGVPTASAIVTRVPVARAVTFPSALTGSVGKAGAAATAQTDFDVQKNGSSVGTIRFAAAATSATFIAASAITLASGDILSVISPATPDATLANVGFVLAGTR